MRRELLGLSILILLAGCSSKPAPVLGHFGSSEGAANGDGDETGDGDGDDTGDGDGDDSEAVGDDDPDGDGICEEQIVTPQRITPDMLIVLDRSGSMKDEEDGVDRWTPSVSGLNSVTDTLDDVIRFGLMTFPGASQGGNGGGDNCAPGSLDAPIALNNGPTIAGLLGAMEPEGRTPTSATLEAALGVLGVNSSDPDAFAPPKFVLLVTDGAPNCTGGGRGDDDRAVDASVAAIEALAAAGIPTYVLGYDTQADGELSAALDRMAQAGNTGDQAHRPIDDEASLVQEFQEIIASAVTCDFKLDQAAEDPSYVRVDLDGQQLAHGEADGWQLSEDKQKVSLQGSACSTLRSSGDHKLSVVVQCTVVTIL